MDRFMEMTAQLETEELEETVQSVSDADLDYAQSGDTT